LQGLKGDTGATGPQGPIGPSDAFSVERGNEITIGSTLMTVLTLTSIPPGKYVVFGNITVGNLNSPQTVPVNCYLGSPTIEWSPPYSARLDPFNSSTAGSDAPSGASVQTIALTLTTVLDTPGDIQLACISNTGNSNTADAVGRQITAIRVGNLVETDLAP
jgi:hypothetical protein